MGRSRDPFADPPFGADSTRVEDAAVRSALRWANIPVGAVARHFGAGAADRLTFGMIRECSDFPFLPAVTGVVPDGPLDLLDRFERTRLFSAWVEAATQHLVFRGGDWGIGVLWLAEEPPDRPHLSLRTAEGSVFVAEKFVRWVSTIGWGSEDFRHSSD